MSVFLFLPPENATIMPSIKSILRTVLLLLAVQHSAIAQVVVEDEGISLNQAELTFIVSQWTDQMKKSAANDPGDRLELLNRVLMVKKMAAEADKISPDSAAYWPLATTLMNEKRKFILQEYVNNLKVPDMSKLAAERYETEKEKYALVPEKRISSHILFACPPGSCSREETKVKAQKVLDELNAGADFTAAVEAYSGDPGSKAKGGKFNKWIRLGEPGVAGPYSEGLFTIGKVGEYSGLVSTQFGVHIIRLDGVEEAHFLTYDEVKAKIIADLEAEFRRSSITEFNRSFNMTDQVIIDNEAVDAIFAPYRAAGE
ncbi:MAG: peptidylprolyl isomerase [Halioglobus sp.]